MKSEHSEGVLAKPRRGVTLLDCTLRDGGYYNDWDFSPAIVKRYVSAIERSRVPVVEIGFRTLDASRYLGPTAFSTDRYLRSLDLPSGLIVGVMMNAKEAVAGGGADVVDRLFVAADESPVGLVRFATNYSELEGLEPSVERLHSLGYRVGVNLMQIASRTPDEVSSFGSWCTRLGVDIAYFADSFGGMHPGDITEVVGTIRNSFAGEIGCHTHDNMSLAFANTLAAIDAGATHADATVLGMGRGPGNARTEYVAIELERRDLADLDPVPLISLAAGEFADLQRDFGWGSSAYYFLSAARDIHPTYIQEMTKDGRYSVDEVVAAVDALGMTDGGSFSPVRMEAAAATLGIEHSDGTWDATGWCEGRDLLILGPGPNGVERRADIESYIRAERPLVMSINAVPQVDAELVDVVVICHPLRAVIDVDDITAWSQPVVIPASIWERAAADAALHEHRDYGMSVEPGRFEARAESCTIPRIDAFGYALALAAIGRAREVHLTGFDGFDASNPRQHEMIEVLELFQAVDDAPTIRSLTRTTYPIPQSSIYAS